MTPEVNRSQAPVVMIVDDDPESVLLVSTMVEYCGYQALQALDHAQALAGLERQPAALVLDMIMPNADSERLTDKIIDAGSRLPVVLISAASSDALAACAAALRARGANVVATLAKPFWIEPLIGALELAIHDVGAIGGSGS